MRDFEKECELRIVTLGKKGAILEQDISNAERRIGRVFPPSYKKWLLDYETANIHGSFILSPAPLDICEDADTDIATAHLVNVSNGMAAENEISIFEPDWNEIFFFDCNLSGDNGEWPVFVRSIETGDVEKFADDFDSFVNKIVRMVKVA